MKIVLGGPPHSGKSCLREGLKQAIRAIPNTPYPYVITACPDGEGCWHYEAVSCDPKNAETLKRDYKGEFTDSFVKRVSDDVKNCREPLTLIDIGGKITDDNIIICKHATHIILIAGNMDELDVWRNFSKHLNLQIIAELHSDYHGTEDTILKLENDNIYRGSIHYLDREDDSAKERPTVKQLAKIIVEMTPTYIKNMNKDTTTFNIELKDNNELKIGFGKKSAQNNEIVKDVEQRLEQLIENGDIAGGEIIKINGPATLPVAMVFAHKLSHLYQAIACYDPKLAKYVVAIAHGDKYSIGELLE
ncbi:CRISPR-associated protein Csx3 [Candidatus Halobeggiatoa sp. HSG11]|nr:CRISPR-associated protein Csx3 [Candidatus Halobeggiatoa sp. HSG11]